MKVEVRTQYLDILLMRKTISNLFIGLLLATKRKHLAIPGVTEASFSNLKPLFCPLIRVVYIRYTNMSV